MGKRPNVKQNYFCDHCPYETLKNYFIRKKKKQICRPFNNINYVPCDKKKTTVDGHLGSLRKCRKALRSISHFNCQELDLF